MTKPWWASRTVWVNLLFVTFTVFYFFCPKIRSALKGDEIMYASVLAYVNLFLRSTTKQGIAILFAALLVSCSSADIKVQSDPNPPPLDTNFHNILMDATCAKGPAAGQIGCSLPYNEDLSKQVLTIFSPLGGALRIYSRTCGTDKSYFLSKGEKFNITLDEIVAPQAEFCTFSIFMRWDKPAEITTEVPFRGQSGKFYLRLRPYGTEPARLIWTPTQGALKESSGILYAQFRGLANPIGPHAPIPVANREPLLLRIKTTSPVSVGKFQLWSEAKKIGIKTGDFAGDEILIGRDDILGPAKVDSYELTGFAVGKDLDNDFRVAVDVFRYDTQFLAGKVTLEPKQVCYETESVVSLVVLSGVDKASNKAKDCFPRPTGDALIGFFTNVGRAAYATIQGEKVTWLQ